MLGAWAIDSGGSWGNWASDKVGDVGVMRSGVGGALKQKRDIKLTT